MPARYDLPNYLTALAFLPTAAISSDSNGSPFDLVGYEGKIIARADIGNATAGTNPTLDLVFKMSTDNSNWVNANIAFTQATNTASQVVGIDPRAVYRYLRLDRDIGGTNSPSFPVSVVGFATAQNNPA